MESIIKSTLCDDSEDARYHGGIAPKAAWLSLFTPYEELSTGINSWPNLIGISHPTGA